VNPPRDLPSPWSSGSALTLPGGSFCTAPRRRALAACWCARQPVESTLTSQKISPAASALACNNVNSRAHTPTLPPPEQPIHPLPRSVLERQVPPWNSSPNPPPHSVYQPPTTRPPATKCPPQAATTPASTPGHQKAPLAPHLDHHRAGRAQESESKTRPSQPLHGRRVRDVQEPHLSSH
jgi:hypothetical protein